MIKNRIDNFVTEINTLSDFKGKQECFTSFLKNIDDAEDVLIFLSHGFKVFINTMLVTKNIKQPSIDWQVRETSVSAWSYRNKIRIGCEDQGISPVFFRRPFKNSISQSETVFYELSQEIEHLLNLFYIESRKAYCLVDEDGATVEVFKIIENEKYSALIFKRIYFEYYLWLKKANVFRLFDYTETDHSYFSRYPDNSQKTEYNQDLNCKVESALFEHGIYMRGTQLFSYDRKDIRKFKAYLETLSFETKKFVDVIVFDPFKQQNIIASTDPTKACSYFNMKDNPLPHQLSCVFFKEEVLQKYISNPNIYICNEQQISSLKWDLRDFEHKNGKVQVYLKDFSDLPYKVQVYWKQYNIKPNCKNLKEAISIPKIIRDFGGCFAEDDGIENDFRTLVKELKNRPELWNIPEECDFQTSLIEENRKLWLDNIAQLQRVFIDTMKGNERNLREKIKQNGWSIPNGKEQGSVNALHIILENSGLDLEPLKVLREIVLKRNKGYGHTSNEEIDKFEQEAKEEYGSLKAHYDHLIESLKETLIFLIQKYDEGVFS